MGRMLALAGLPLGLRFRFLDPSPDAPARHVGEYLVGDYGDTALLDRFARGLDVVTFEFENVPVATLARLAEQVPAFPPVVALQVGQDRLLEKRLFQRLGIPVPAFEPVATLDQLHTAVSSLGDGPVIAKTRRGGYDGKGQTVIRTPADSGLAWELLKGRDLLVESLVSFERELSVLAVRSPTGDTRVYPLVENEHQGGILRLSRAPARVSDAVQASAAGYAAAVMEELRYVGVLAIEFFDVGGRLLANEMAPRVHNSGHWTIEGAATCQFENHVRAVAGLPLGPARARGSSVMVNVIGTPPRTDDVLAVEGAHLHLYGKEARPGRKTGHVTITGDDPGVVESAAVRVRSLVERAQG